MIYSPKDGQMAQQPQLTIFLGGTIDNGASKDWQKEAAKELDNENTIIFNPRNEDWDTAMEPVISNPAFRAQVEWELNALNISDIIVINFLPDSKSPISLLELGLYADTGKVFVVCPEEFYRSGNVKLICEIYDITLFDTIEELIETINEHIGLESEDLEN